MGVRKGGGLTRGQRAGIFVNVVLICVLAAAAAIGFVALVRQLSFRHDLRFDLTAELRYELDPLAQQILRSIETPVEITFVWGFDEDIKQRVLDTQGTPRMDLLVQHYLPILIEARARIHRVLEEWSKASSYVSYRVIGSDEDPQAVTTLARNAGRLPEDLVNKVIMKAANRTREIPLRRMMEDMQWGMFPAIPNAPRLEPRMPGAWRVHEELTATLRGLMAGETVRIGLPRDLNSLIGPGTEDYAAMSRILAAEGYRLEPLDLGRLQAIPREIGIVFLPALQAGVPPRAAGILADYERAGGRLLVMADPRLREDFDFLLEPYGCRMPPLMVHDTRHQHPERQGPADLQSSGLCAGRHPIDRPLAGRIDLYVGFCRPIEVAKDHAPGAERTTLLRGSELARGVPVEFTESSGTGELVQGRMTELPQPSLAVALSRPASSGGGEARLVVFGGAHVLDPTALAYPTWFGNRDLLLNSLAWLSNRPSSIGLTPREEARVRTVELARIRPPFLWIAVIGLPALAAIIGLGVHLARRS